MPRHRLLASLEVTAAAGLLAAGLAGALGGNQFIREYLFFFAWYPYLLLVDGLLWRRRGESWIFGRPREFLRLGVWSVTVWLIFEAFNLGLKNWAYVGVTPLWWVRWPGYALAFATVLPGILLTARLLQSLGVWGGVRGRPREVGFAWQPVSLLVGAAFLALPLAFPRYGFPLVWLAFFFLLDPFCPLLGAKSLIESFLLGERREHLCLLAAGLFCGLWWEAWNYPAASRWVYTLPVLHFWKVFEMPLLGYLGFPPFALEAAVMTNFLAALEARLTPRGRQRFYLFQIIFWLVMFTALDRLTVRSFGPSRLFSVFCLLFSVHRLRWQFGLRLN
jgi:hypothetical protein